MPNLCPEPSELAALRPLSASQVQATITNCGLAGATDLDTYNAWKAKFNILPPPPTGGFQPNLVSWIAANYI